MWTVDLVQSLRNDTNRRQRRIIWSNVNVVIFSFCWQQLRIRDFWTLILALTNKSFNLYFLQTNRLTCFYYCDGWIIVVTSEILQYRVLGLSCYAFALTPSCIRNVTLGSDHVLQLNTEDLSINLGKDIRDLFYWINENLKLYLHLFDVVPLACNNLKHANFTTN